MCQMVSTQFSHVHRVDWSRRVRSHVAHHGHWLHHTGAGHRYGIVVSGRRDVHTRGLFLPYCVKTGKSFNQKIS